MRIGYGVDMLRLVPDAKLVLGGVEIPFDRGLDGPGGGDVLARAVMDAMLGACSTCIPKPIPLHETGDAASPLAELASLAEEGRKRGFRVINLDATLLLERPRLAIFIEKMRGNLSRALGVDTMHISIKERSPEGLGPAGRGEGIEARVVMLMNME